MSRDFKRTFVPLFPSRFLCSAGIVLVMCCWKSYDVHFVNSKSEIGNSSQDPETASLETGIRDCTRSYTLHSPGGEIDWRADRKCFPGNPSPLTLTEPNLVVRGITVHPRRGTSMSKVVFRQDLHSPLGPCAEQLCSGATPQLSSKWAQRLTGRPLQ